MNYETNLSLCNAHEISSSDAYFAPRPLADSREGRKLFSDGFERGWNARAKQHSGEVVAEATQAQDAKHIADYVLDDETRWILGQPSFSMHGFAQRLRANGFEIKSKAEDEQAVVIHWMLNMYKKHGKDWRAKVAEWIDQTSQSKSED